MHQANKAYEAKQEGVYRGRIVSSNSQDESNRERISIKITDSIPISYQGRRYNYTGFSFAAYREGLKDLGVIFLSNNKVEVPHNAVKTLIEKLNENGRLVRKIVWQNAEDEAYRILEEEETKHRVQGDNS